MIARKGTITRDLDQKECHWLDNPINKGTTVYSFHGATYGCISPSGIAISFISRDEVEGNPPFTEVPRNAVVFE